MSTHGDIAEKQYEHWAEQHGVEFVRYGLQNMRGIRPLSTFVRATPDYLEEERLVEVMGFADGVVKLKQHKYLDLVRWNQHMTVDLWLFDATNREFGEISVNRLPVGWAVIGRFPEGTPYYAWTKDTLKIEWKPVEGWVESKWHRGP